jgi:Ca2+-binding EF-hand superfamily protein
VTIPATATDQEVTDFFAGADADKDGAVTKDEIKAYY